MQVQGNNLIGAEVSQRSTTKMGGALRPQFLIVHYTAGASFSSDVKSLSVDPVKASVHLVVGRAGEITQIVPFNRVAWHAGLSSWGPLEGMNNHAIGIELSNAGLLHKNAAGEFKSWWGASIKSTEVYEAAHEKGGPVVGWHTYPKAQIATLLEVIRVLHTKYDFAGILGHDDVSWPRKTDPGPAFPMRSLRSVIYGRA